MAFSCCPGLSRWSATSRESPVESLLDKAPITLREAAGGEELLSMLARERVDIALVDLRRPGLGTLELPD